MTAPRFTIVATWDCDSDVEALAIRDQVAALEPRAEIQILRLEGEKLTAVTPDIGSEDRVEETLRNAGAAHEPLPSWQAQVFARIATLSEREDRLLVAAHMTLAQLQEDLDGKVPATCEAFRHWAQEIASFLAGHVGEEREHVEIDQPTAAHKVNLQVRIRALGVTILFPPDPAGRR